MRGAIIVLGLAIAGVGFTLGAKEHDPMGFIFGVAGVALFIWALTASRFQ